MSIRFGISHKILPRSLLPVCALFPAQSCLRSIQLGGQVRNDQLLVRVIVRPSLDRLVVQCYRHRLLDAENGDRLEFLTNGVLSPALNVQFAIAREEVQGAVRSRGVAFAVVNVSVAPRSACLIQ